MLRNEVGNLLRQPDFFRESRSIRDVARDDLRALIWAQSIVWIVTLLIFDEVLRRREFADVVIKRADAGEKWICADRTAGIFRKLSNGM